MSTLTDRFGVTNQQKADIDGTYTDLRAQATTAGDTGAYTQAEVDSIVASAVPSGVITMWSGATTSVPSGWVLCNGTNGTPDLVNRFIVGAGGTYAVGDTGGASSVTLTESQIPSHSHTAGQDGGHSHTASSSTTGSHNHGGYTGTGGAHTHSYSRLRSSSPLSSGGYNNAPSGYQTLNTGSAGSHSLSIASDGDHSHTITVNSVNDHSHTISATGGDAAHENRPPYYALAYIMKV